MLSHATTSTPRAVIWLRAFAFRPTRQRALTIGNRLVAIPVQGRASARVVLWLRAVRTGRVTTRRKAANSAAIARSMVRATAPASPARQLAQRCRGIAQPTSEPHASTQASVRMRANVLPTSKHAIARFGRASVRRLTACAAARTPRARHPALAFAHPPAPARSTLARLAMWPHSRW